MKTYLIIFLLPRPGLLIRSGDDLRGLLAVSESCIMNPDSSGADDFPNAVPRALALTVSIPGEDITFAVGREDYTGKIISRP